MAIIRELVDVTYQSRRKEIILTSPTTLKLLFGSYPALHLISEVQ